MKAEWRPPSQHQLDFVLEGLRLRANRHGDDFEPEFGKVRIRCFDPHKHKKGDAHPSAIYGSGRYGCLRILCENCGLGDMAPGGLTVAEIAEMKERNGLPRLR